MRNTKRHGTSWKNLLGLAICFAPAASSWSHAQIDPGAALMAEQFGQLSRGALSTGISTLTVQQAQLYLEGAVRINPTEPRFHRLRIEAALQIGDYKKAIDAINAYRAIPAGMADDVAKAKLIELYLASMQTAEARLNYLTKIVDATAESAELRSHAAYLLAMLNEDRLRDTAVEESLDAALRFNPLNPQAWNMYYARVQGRGDLAAEARALLGMLRTNPAQPAVMASLASLLADAGLADAARPWFMRAFETAPRVGAQLDLNDMVDFVACLIALDRDGDASLTIDAMQRFDANSTEAAFLRLILAQRRNDPGDLAVAQTAASNAIIARLVQYSEALASGATTRPSPVQEAAASAPKLPDIASDVTKLKAGVSEEIYSGYVQCLSDLAFYNVYFANKPNEARPVIQQLKLLLEDDNILIPRLEGWCALAEGNPQEANVSLSAVADRDMIARVGMIRLADADPATKDKAKEDAIALLQLNRGGLAGAMLRQVLRPIAGTVMPSEQDARIREELAKFPMTWLDILDRPSTFYQLRIVPLKVAHAFGEPMLVRVSMSNISEFDIALGQLGTVRPDLWFDANVRGVVQKNVGGIAYDRMSYTPVLKRKSAEISQVVRIDDGALQGLLGSSPLLSVPLYASGFTNPVGGVEAGIVPGPAGQRVQATKVMERLATPMQPATIQTLMTRLNVAPADEKMRAVELFASVIPLVKKKGELDEQDRALINLFTQSIERFSSDQDANVKTWASAATVVLGEGERKTASLQRMLASTDWQTRMLAMSLLQGAPPEIFEPGINKLLEDSDPLVKELARVTNQLRAEAAEKRAATTGPTTNPTSASPPPPAGNLPATPDIGAGLNK